MTKTRSTNCFNGLHLKLRKDIKKISVSFSGGRTSGMMAFIMKKFADETGAEIVFTFANTGLEHEGTYKFVNDCDVKYGLNVVWVEPVVSPVYGEGIKHKVVTYQTATRGVGCFEDIVKKYGLPSQANPHCTTYLKVYPMQSYLRSIGYKAKTYHTCIGIRADEIDRVNSDYKNLKLWYPLCDLGISKEMVFNFWKNQSFDIEIPDNFGNCKTCWKKSKKKLFNVYEKEPSAFDPFLYLDKNYHTRVIEKKDKSVTVKRKMYRGNMDTQDIINEAKNYLHNKKQQLVLDFNVQNSCEESCEVYSEDHLRILNEEK